jgi:hypothetical protein
MGIFYPDEDGLVDTPHAGGFDPADNMVAVAIEDEQRMNVTFYPAADNNSVLVQRHARVIVEPRQKGEVFFRIHGNNLEKIRTT